ncbi:MAG: NAD(P)/FAD-dependent oxidoreductase [Balneolales bacterium]
MTIREHYDVIIVGAGPVGLFLGLRLMQLGVSFIILEKRAALHSHSRSIGIHPPSLELFDEIGLSEQFLNKGTCIRKGKAFRDASHCIGTLDFDLCPKPFTYVLTLPQYHTEQILQEALLEKAPDCIRRGLEITSFRQSEHQVEIKYLQGPKKYNLTSSYLIGCDGKNSIIRERSDIPFEGGKYPYRYAMGDFEDNTKFESNAVVYIGNSGLVESFPLSGNIRRWVAELPKDVHDCSLPQFCEIILRRTNFELNKSTVTMFSNFDGEHYLAGKFNLGRILLIGDSAHVVSPIGGQGMNLGWMGAWHLGEALQNTLKQKYSSGRFLSNWEKRHRKKATKAIKRAEFNMALGQKSKWPELRSYIVKYLLKFPLNNLIVRRFTMRGLN